LRHFTVYFTTLYSDLETLIEVTQCHRNQHVSISHI